MSFAADPNIVPDSISLLTTAGTAEQSSSKTVGTGIGRSESVMPKLALVVAGGDLTLHYPDGSSAQFAATAGMMLPGGFDGFDSSSDTSGVILAAWY